MLCYASDGGYLRKQKGNGQLEKTTGSLSQRRAQQGSGGSQRSTAPIYAVEIWDRQGPRSSARSLGLRDDDDDDEGWLVLKMEGKTNFSRHLQAVRHRDCWVFENHWRMVHLTSMIFKHSTEDAFFIFGHKRKWSSIFGRKRKKTKMTK